MDFKKLNAPGSTITWDTEKLSAPTGNIYESVVICGKRANEISVDMKEELTRKLQDFASLTDNLEEVFENREQIEISKYYERLAKPVSISVQEFSEGKIKHSYPAPEEA